MIAGVEVIFLLVLELFEISEKLIKLLRAFPEVSESFYLL
jgi:hypothetical protein